MLEMKANLSSLNDVFIYLYSCYSFTALQPDINLLIFRNSLCYDIPIRIIIIRTETKRINIQ